LDAVADIVTAAIAERPYEGHEIESLGRSTAVAVIQLLMTK
jgi:hypothetical protein